MKYAVISDVHANESALAKVLADAHAAGVGEVVCLGDVVGYGPSPSEAVALVRSSCKTVIAGNHDDAVSGRGGIEEFIDLAGDAAARHRDALSSDDIAWLKSLPYTCRFGGAVAAHGDLFDPPKFYYVESESDAKATFDATDSQLVFVGHTHVPCIFLTGQSGAVYRTPPQDFTLEAGKRYIVNPGSVGYPRECDGKCLSTYVIYDDAENTVEFRSIPFAVSSVMQRGRPAGKTRKWLVAAFVGAAAVLAVFATWTLARKAPEGERVPANDAKPPNATANADTPAPTNAPATKVAAAAPAAATAALPAAKPAVQKSPVIATKRLKIPPKTKSISPGIALRKKPKSPPVNLRMRYFDAKGRMVHEEYAPVKLSKGKTTLPWAARSKGAVEVEFAVLKVRDGDKPALEAFKPSVSN